MRPSYDFCSDTDCWSLDRRVRGQHQQHHEGVQLHGRLPRGCGDPRLGSLQLAELQ
jgi:hypothetical protein